MKHYPVKGEKIHILSDEEFTNKLVFQYGYKRWRARLMGGFALPTLKEIYIRVSRREDVKLLNHERGHLRGYNHTWLLTLMFPSWIGRIFNRYDPPYHD
jgi:hypothetical protein